MSALGLNPPPPSGPGLFRAGGDFYITLPRLLFHELHQLLPKSELAAAVNAAIRVMAFLVEMARLDKLDPLLTDQVIADEIGISKRSVQRGLWALDVVLGKIGMPIITRMRSHGRRIISFVRGFAARGSAAPPQTPLKTSETTTTREASSSSGSPGEKTGEAREIVPPELVARAMKLVLEATQGKVLDAVAIYGVDWVSRALDVVEKRTKNRNNLPVKSWGFVLNTLRNWKREGGPPPVDPPAAPIPARLKDEPAKAEPSQRLTPLEVAELLARCQSGKRVESNFARIQLRQALAEGLIETEELATIPAELKEPTKPRAP